MNTTSLEISKRLYELSGWDDTDDHYPKTSNHEYSPAYDLGYLLRKLPRYAGGMAFQLSSTSPSGGESWQISYPTGYVNAFGRADTPEDAAGLLAIKLFEEGVL